MAQPAFIDDVLRVAEEAEPFLNIQDKEGYKKTLDVIESLLDYIDEEKEELFLTQMLEGLSKAVERFENQQEGVQAFVRAVNNEPADISTLRLLMAQHNLTGSDLPEIGGKSNVSLILSGERKLTRQHIEKLAARFKISPALFFDEVKN